MGGEGGLGWNSHLPCLKGTRIIQVLRGLSSDRICFEAGILISSRHLSTS